MLSNSAGANSYSGDTTINGGILVLGSTTSAQNSRVISAVNKGLQFAPAVGSFTIGALSDKLDTTPGGDIALVDNDTTPVPVVLTIANPASLTMIYSGKLTGSGSLILGNGQLTLNGNNTYSGGTTINGGTLVLGNDAVLGAVTGSLTVGGTLDLNGHSIAVRALGGGGTITNNVGGALTFTVGDATPMSSFFGTISDGSGGGTVSLVKQGTGVQTLIGSNSYSGTTRISQGTLQLGSSSAINGASQIILAGGKLDAFGNSPTLQCAAEALLGSSAIDLGLASSGTVQFAATNASTWATGSTVSIFNWAGTPGPAGSGKTEIIFGSNSSGLINARTSAPWMPRSISKATTAPNLKHRRSGSSHGFAARWAILNINGSLDAGDITAMLRCCYGFERLQAGLQPIAFGVPIRTNERRFSAEPRRR